MGRISDSVAADPRQPSPGVRVSLAHEIDDARAVAGLERVRELLLERPRQRMLGV